MEKYERSKFGYFEPGRGYNQPVYRSGYGDQGQGQHQWPAAGSAQNVDERVKSKNRTFDGGGGRGQIQGALSSCSDENERNSAKEKYVQSESDSDSARRKWTKNPLVVRRMKRSDKTRQVEKRLSGPGNSSADKSDRNSATYHSNEESRSRENRTDGQDMKESGQGFPRGTSKYQRLEEMRRRRLNLSVTSDEEGVTPVAPTARWSGSGLHKLAQTSKVAENHPTRPLSGVETFPQHHPASSGSHLPIRNLQPPDSRISCLAPTFPQSLTRTAVLVSQNRRISPPPRSPEVTKTQTWLHSTPYVAPPQYKSGLVPCTKGSNSQSLGSAPPVPVLAHSAQTQLIKQARGVQYTPTSMTTAQFTPQVRIPTAGSTTDRHHFQSGTIPAPTERVFSGDSTRRFSPADETSSQKDNRLDYHQHPPSARKMPRFGPAVIQTDDSLDELFESNIQYLTAGSYNKPKPKKTIESNSNLVNFSSHPAQSYTTGNTSSFQNFSRQPSIQVQARTNIQVHVTLPMESYPMSQSIGSPNSQSSSLRAQAPEDTFGSFRSAPHQNLSAWSYTQGTTSQPPNANTYTEKALLPPRDFPRSNKPGTATSTASGVQDWRSKSDSENIPRGVHLDRGMFSDVDYDIEVSERVKKWENVLKVPDPKSSANKKSLSAIEENVDNQYNPTARTDVGKLPILDSRSRFGPVTGQTGFVNSSQALKNTWVHKSLKEPTPNVVAIQANTFNVIQANKDPHINIQSKSISTFLQTPISVRSQQILVTPAYFYPKTNSQSQPSFPQTSQADQNTHLSSQAQVFSKVQPASPATLQIDDTKPSKPIEVNTKVSKYKQDLTETKAIKANSVNNLRRRFDSDSTNVTSEEDKRAISTASAKLVRPAKVSNPGTVTDWSKVLPGYQGTLKEPEVWSPNLESTQGVPVSIERVTARTLRTIPFSEDPFWKEIEQITSFEAAAVPSVGCVQSEMTTEPVRSQHRMALSIPGCASLPTQPRPHLISANERMSKSKSLYEPAIEPLTVETTEQPSSNSEHPPSLYGTRMSYINEKNASPLKEPLEAQTLKFVPRQQNQTMPSLNANIASNVPFQGETHAFRQSKLNPIAHGLPDHQLNNQEVLPSRTTATHPRPSQPFYQYSRPQEQQPSQPAPGNSRPPPTWQSNANNYRLDPDLLKQKLLNTGLVVDQDTRESPGRRQLSRPWAGPSLLGETPEVITSKVNPSISEAKHTVTESKGTSSEVASQMKCEPETSRDKPLEASRQSALYNVQRALSSFEHAPYKPNPETLYGVSKLQSFKEPTNAVAFGASSRKASSQKSDRDMSDREVPGTGGVVTQPSTRLQQVNQSMDDLKNLALDVEDKISCIKTRLATADEESLDSILLSLRQVKPHVKTHDTDEANFEDFYTSKKSKLSGALAELDRIYASLDLDSSETPGLKLEASPKPSSQITKNSKPLSPRPEQNKSVHLRPMQTRISSVYIRGIDAGSKKDHEGKESEFEIISKSFQAIVDEVTQTTELLSRAVESNKNPNLAPEVHQHSFRIAPQQENTRICKPSPEKSTTNLEPTALPHSSAVSEYLKHEPRKDEGKVASKSPDTSIDANNKSVLTKEIIFVPNVIPTKLSGLMQTNSNINADHSPTNHNSVSSTVKVTASIIPEAATSVVDDTDSRSKARPVRDNRIVLEDKAAKVRSLNSPSMSPTVLRKFSSNVNTDNRPFTQEKQKSPGNEREFSTMIKGETQEQGMDVPKSSFNSLTQTNLDPSTRQETLLLETHSSPPGNITKIDQDRYKTKPSLVGVTYNDDSQPIKSGTKHNQKGQEVSQAPMEITRTVSKSDSAENLSKSKKPMGTGVAMLLGRFTGDKVETVLKMTKRKEVVDKKATTGEGKDGERVDGKKSPVVVDKTGTLESSDKNLHSPSNKDSTKTFATPCGKPAASSTDRKMVDPDVKGVTSGPWWSQPSARVQKPPQSPGRRHCSDPDKQTVSDVVKSGSPKFGFRLARTVSSNGSTASEGYYTPQEMGSPGASGESPTAPEGKVIAQNNSVRARPHSFHELIACFEKDAIRLQNSDKFRKSISAGEVSCRGEKGFH